MCCNQRLVVLMLVIKPLGLTSAWFNSFTSIIKLLVIAIYRANSLSTVFLKKLFLSAPYRKLVIVAPGDLPCSPLSVLTGAPDKGLKSGLTVHQNWTPFKKQPSSRMDDCADTFNVFQVTREQASLNS